MNIAIAGLGVVGTGVYDQLLMNKDKIEVVIEDELVISYGLVKTITPKLKKHYTQLTLTTDILEVLNDKNVDCIIDCFGNVEFSYHVIKKALQNGINIVSTNAYLISIYGVELMMLAKKNNCDFYYESVIAGGVPVVRSISKGLASDYVYDVMGILNGTTNFILSKMTLDHIDFDEALEQARALGYVEEDYINDINGYDTARRISILAMLCFNMKVTFMDVNCTGIENVSMHDVDIALKLGYQIKLLGHSYIDDGSLFINVHPCFVAQEHYLCKASYEVHTVCIQCATLGNMVLSGTATGALPSATGVLSDLLNVALNKKYHSNGCDIVYPTLEKNITLGKRKSKFIFLGDETTVQTILTRIPIIKYTKEYVLCELEEELAYQLEKENGWKVYPLIDVS